MKEQEQAHEQNLIANQTTTRIIMGGLGMFNVPILSSVDGMMADARGYQKASSDE